MQKRLAENCWNNGKTVRINILKNDSERTPKSSRYDDVGPSYEILQYHLRPI